MKFYKVFQIVFIYASLARADYSDDLELDECCIQGERKSMLSSSGFDCSSIKKVENVDEDFGRTQTCVNEAKRCCTVVTGEKESCSAGMKFAESKKCSVPATDMGKRCCEECSFGRWTGESQGVEGCGSPESYDGSVSFTLRKNAFYKCCKDEAENPETTTEVRTTTEKKVETTTEKKEVAKCKKNSCEQICNDEHGIVQCACREGYRLQADKKSCKDINECAEAIDDLCTVEGTVCHNTPGGFKCVPIKKRDTSLSCPPGFKKNVVNQVCDDINECQLPRPPCPKYLCENTIGGYKCAGKPGKTFAEDSPGPVTESSASTTPTEKNDICPPGFRAGSDDECLDIDECDERLDDCQRLSQHCINTHGSFFCQDHVSKRCAPGFKVNSATGVCEDIDECEESMEVCKRTEVCVNLPGAYNCKSKISTLPKLATKQCQEGTRRKSGGTVCEDIDECQEGTHLCDRFQNCINTFGGHECRCKNGFELDSGSGSCVDIDECSLKLDNCGSGTSCVNVLGSFTCSRRPATTSTTTPPPLYEYEYYDSEEDNTTSETGTVPETVPSIPVTVTTHKPTTTTRIITTNSSTTPKPRPTYPTRPQNTPRRPEFTPARPEYTPRRPEYTPRRPEDSPRRPPEDSPRTPDYQPPRPEEYPRRPEYKPTSYDEEPLKPEDYPRTPEETPRRPGGNNRPEYTPTRPGNRRTQTTVRRPKPTPPMVVTVPTPPNNTATIEKESRPEGGFEINTGDIPEGKWTNVVDKDSNPSEKPFDPNEVHCLGGYEKDAYGNCVDTNECTQGHHVCSRLERCVNRPGGYVCECISGFRRDASGWCSVIPPPPTTTTPRTTTPRPTTVRTTTSTTTSTTTTTPRPTEPTPAEVWPYIPSRRRGGRVYPPPLVCELGFTFDDNLGKCVDIDECTTHTATCATNEDCVNIEGGYRCVCGRRCSGDSEKPNTNVIPSSGSRVPSSSGSNVITVGAQYGQRGPLSPRPIYSRTQDSIVTSCPWGYKLTSDKRCHDIDECVQKTSECGPQQRCENFYGGYACQCPTGHRLVGQNGCEDIDECVHGTPCSYNSRCVNSVGSYRCVCGDGFRNAPSNDKVCVDVDECSETPQVCEQSCANAWGGYRCYCKRGYRLRSDNRTCEDVDECAEWSTVRIRGKLCGGECINEPGSYRCACPAGYRLSQDARSCIDIDECETGEASCSHTSDPGYVCQNTRGSYHCHHIKCPAGYQLESKHRCTRIQRSCLIADWECLKQPSTYSYNFITFVANIYLPTGSVDLFTMHGPMWQDVVVSFEMRMVDVQASAGVNPADLRCFDMRPSSNICVISLLCPLEGPQVAELELTMSLYQRGQFAGSAVARLIVIVSEYEF